MAVFRDTTFSRRGLGAAGALAAVLPLADATAAPPPSPVLRQAQFVLELYRAEGDAVGAYSRLEGKDGEEEAKRAVKVAFEAWSDAVFDLAEMPAKDAEDLLAKAALVMRSVDNGATDAEGELAQSILADLWRLRPALRPLLRWSPAWREALA